MLGERTARDLWPHLMLEFNRANPIEIDSEWKDIYYSFSTMLIMITCSCWNDLTGFIILCRDLPGIYLRLKKEMYLVLLFGLPHFIAFSVVFRCYFHLLSWNSLQYFCCLVSSPSLCLPFFMPLAFSIVTGVHSFWWNSHHRFSGGHKTNDLRVVASDS